MNRFLQIDSRHETVPSSLFMPELCFRTFSIADDFHPVGAGDLWIFERIRRLRKSTFSGADFGMDYDIHLHILHIA